MSTPPHVRLTPTPAASDAVDERHGSSLFGGGEAHPADDLELVEREAHEAGAEDPGHGGRVAEFEVDEGVVEDLEAEDVRGEERPAEPKAAPARSMTTMSRSASGITMPWFFAPPIACTRLPAA